MFLVQLWLTLTLFRLKSLFNLCSLWKCLSRKCLSEYITLELTRTNAQSKNFLKFVSGNSYLASASFSLSYSIVKHGRPFSDAEFLKSAFMDCAPFLFDDFKNKDAIIKRIEELRISINTV